MDDSIPGGSTLLVQRVLGPQGLVVVVVLFLAGFLGFFLGSVFSWVQFLAGRFPFFLAVAERDSI